ncbi:MAG: aminotransferase class I/II-fold pyridoxal phosphate-dependent enzyme [Clostridium sp.]|jgi:histidinol-phosphate/aromatic aminotransferase/cobyric acid decarboxylase-like protein/choline kinase|nr:aminotransferase class I/II-fold pyridoxal phosphate-dependent enzyme [Clostridium sp.]
MQAMILAAGMGKRLKHLTENNTKCMVKVNETSIIERALRILDRKGLSKIVLVVGYKGKKLIEFVEQLGIHTPLVYVWNYDYEKTNNIYSLSLAKEYLCREDTLLLESDLVFEESIIDMLLEDKRTSLALVDKFESWMDGSCMVIDEADRILDFIPGKYFDFREKENYYKTVNIYKLSRQFSKNIYVPFLEAYEKAMGENEYYESVIKLIVMLDTSEIRVKRLNGQKWYEIDDVQDLDIAESLFEDDIEKRYNNFMKRYGGFWRYPHMIDYCYLVNPYFPNQRLTEEMTCNYSSLLSQYPSGREVDSIVTSNVFGVNKDYIVLSNGAAELIKIFMEEQSGTVGIICPSFNEYKERCEREVLVYQPEGADLRYTENDIIQFFDGKIQLLVLINPDNPSGNFIPISGVMKILEWAKQAGIKVLVDESFVDFADLADGESIEDNTLIREEILKEYKNLYVVKSISKSYGVPGLRLGVLASADEEKVNQIKKNMPIWNINSFAEFFMQIIPKYRKDYAAALVEFRKTRKDFLEKLEQIEYLKAVPTQANYVMCEVIGRSAGEICICLFEKGILIKNLTEKVKNDRQYIRIAIRTREENDQVLKILNEI